MPDDFSFLKSLAAVRPGASLQSLRQLAGARWREPLPHARGLVACLRHSHGFTAQVDVHGIVGRVVFGTLWSDPPFSADVDVAGLQAGMSLQEARRRYPQLSIHAGRHPAPTCGFLKLGAGVVVRLQFLYEQLRVVEILDETAIFPARIPIAYPAPAGPPGYPFHDPNFKLVVLSDLLDRNVIHLGRLEELAVFLIGRPFDDQEARGLIRPVYDYLVRFPLGAGELDAVERIMFDGGLSIYSYIWPSRDGESEEFGVQNVDGIDLCRNATELVDLPVKNGCDFRSAPFRLLPKLSTLTLTIGCYSNIEALLDLPALRECHVRGNRILADVSTPGHPSRQVMERLRARGVKVRVQYASCEGFGPPPPAFGDFW